MGSNPNWITKRNDAAFGGIFIFSSGTSLRLDSTDKIKMKAGFARGIVSFIAGPLKRDHEIIPAGITNGLVPLVLRM